VVINYVNQTGALACEVLEFEVNKWCAAMARTSSVKINLVFVKELTDFAFHDLVAQVRSTGKISNSPSIVRVAPNVVRHHH